MNEKSTHVVVLGAGYAGLMAAMRLAKKTDSRDVTITLVNAMDTFNERVRNHQLISGQRIPERPLPELIAKTRIRFQQGTVRSIEPDRHTVIVETGPDQTVDMRYDHLIYALGSRVDVGSTPGAREYAYTLDEHSAAALAPLLPDLAARGARVLLVGAGNTGVEVSTELAERFPDLDVTVVTRSSFARNLSEGAQRHIRKAFSRLGISLIEHAEVIRLEPHEAVTAAGTIPFDVCIWVGGFEVSDLARSAGIRVNGRGQILVDRALRSLSHPDIFAAGDAAMPADDPGTPIRMSLYAAAPMGAHAADALAALLHGRQPSPFGLSFIAQGLSLGRRDGVVQFLDGSTDTATRFMITGMIANFFREFFVAFLLLTIRLQRTIPWVFYWPGKNKMRSRASTERSTREAAHADG